MPPRETIWPLDPHTKAKHDLLRRYLGAWFPILTTSGYNRRVIFMDGFAGPGVYDSGEPGSPIVALSTLVDHPVFDKLTQTEFVFAFVEADEARFESLEAEIEAFWEDRGGRPKNVRISTVNESFEDAAEALCGDMAAKNATLAPTLAFVDPFGYSGASLETICRLTSFPKCEIIFNFMYSWLTRGVAHPNEGVRTRLHELFGTDEVDEAEGLVAAERKEFLHDLYERQLRDEGNFKFVLDFEMVDRRGKSYSLFFGTRHIKGLESMKQAMWRVDPSGEFRFSDRHHGTTSLFGGKPDVGPLRYALLEEFEGRVVTIERIHEFVLANTIYGPSHYRRAVLAPLEKAGEIEVVESSRARANGYPPGTRIRFDD